ncbi:hypothetical protein [Micromonospora cathayae]|uniref:DUF3168 domain-containing protein n=1 Tax=Micromonospora cathayae TaxID=3028804 RepID=A0ABY7ZVV0_9ACTN|nr:hypothetical protein [Micromonospora sp. HUAS 3]WDZ87187.1 hypothetical protein PVK37_12665 [Micromonospora sp. HUAS 3]
MAYPLLPDVDQALVDYLKTRPALVPLHGGRVGTKLQSTATAVRITNLGGGQPWPWEAEPEYQVEWWGGTDVQASDLSRAGEAALWAILGPITGGRITGVSLPLSRLWSPDDTSGRPRFITQVQLRVNPEES